MLARLFDAGLNRNQVAKTLGVSHTAATRRQELWEVLRATMVDVGNPAHKERAGAGSKLTEAGAEACYRLFDSGKSRNVVGKLMEISYPAASYRYERWKSWAG